MRTFITAFTVAAVLGISLAACAREQNTTNKQPEASGSTPSEVGQPPASPANPPATGDQSGGTSGSATGDTSEGNAAGPYAILPGERIGHVTIGENLLDVNADLGRPDSGDAATGHVWAYWFSKTSDDVLGVYATFDSNGTGHYVREIRITSPAFHLPSGISTGDSFSEAQRQFDQITPVAEYTSEKGQGTVTVFDAIASGIAFEVAGGSASDRASGEIVAMVVHRPGHSITQEYIPYRNYHRLD